jgi:hypothetical protein
MVPLFPTDSHAFCTAFHFFPQPSRFGTYFYFCAMITARILLPMKFLSRDLRFMAQVFQNFEEKI